MEEKEKKLQEIDELLATASAAGLEGLDFLSRFTRDQLADGYNGIGPEFLPPIARETVSDFLHIFKPAAVAHDLRNELSDGTRDGFRAANAEFFRNCIRLADYHYRADDPRNRRARAVAAVLYAFVSADFFGWRAWLEAKDRHAKKLANPASVWNKTNTKGKPMKKLMIVAAIAAVAAGVTGCKSIEVERHGQSLATIQNSDGTVSVVKDAANNPVILDGGWAVDYFQHWNWQRFDSLAAKTKEAELTINNYEGGADATNLTQLVHTSLDGLTKLVATCADAYVKVAGGGAQADTAINVAKKIVSYFNEKGGDVSKATVTTDTASNTVKVSDGSTCVECDAAGNCSECERK